ncbi:MAG: hypothetical protein PWR04_1756 [Anaerophaga sp.]|nr:hypothetical protein [Anaerophaga sp.]
MKTCDLVKFSLLSFLMLTLYGPASRAQVLYTVPEGVHTYWSSFENMNGVKGEGGKENKGAKGHPADQIKAGQTVTLLNVEGAGIIRRIWMTINDCSLEMMRSLRIDMYWDGVDKPAVSAPLGDFFGIGLGRKVAFQNALFADPEGRSFNCFIPMPFKTVAKVTITNESVKNLDALFFDIDWTKHTKLTEETLYFHAYWNRENPTTLGQDLMKGYPSKLPAFSFPNLVYETNASGFENQMGPYFRIR